MKESEDSRTGDGEKQTLNVIATEANSSPTRSSGAEITL